MQSNLDKFLDCTTPVIPSKFLDKAEIDKLNKLWHPWNKDQLEYFTLTDLWNCYNEWSAYGAGVPLLFNNTEPLVQYYVPYLSAIQIFTTSSSIQSLRDETDQLRDGEARGSSTDSCSDESESDKLSRWDGSSSEEGGLMSEQENPFNGRLGHLYFQYFDQSTPYGRVPLIDKINEFARKYPGLMSLRSVDLSPASWMSVAWYPIYHIPMGTTTNTLSTCFLTYHTLSSSFQDMDDSDYETEVDEMKKPKSKKGVYLRPFGMATYKMQGSVWASVKNGHDHQRLVSLLSVADSWLKQLMVQHHDFNHFTKR